MVERLRKSPAVAVFGDVVGLREKLDFRLEYLTSSEYHDWGPVTDYDGQRYLVAVKLSGFEKLDQTPLRFVELQAGYYTEGYTDETRKAGVEPTRNPYLAVGLNLNELLGEAPAVLAHQLVGLRPAIEPVITGAIEADPTETSVPSPTPEPTAVPTAEPTLAPTAVPTATNAPSWIHTAGCGASTASGSPTPTAAPICIGGCRCSWVVVWPSLATGWSKPVRASSAKSFSGASAPC